MGIAVSIALILVAVILFLAVRKGLLHDNTLDTWAKIGGVIAMLAAVLVFVIPTAPSPAAVSPLTSTPSPAPTLTDTPLGPTPAPRSPANKAILYDSLREHGVMTTGTDSDGKSWYDKNGYNVVSLSTKNSWSWVMRTYTVTDAIVEVTATPITDGRVTGYGIVFGWDSTITPTGFFVFEVQSFGNCQFLQGENPSGPGLLTWNISPAYSCAQPMKDQSAKIRLEIVQQHVVAFINDQYVTQADFPSYSGGRLGFYCFNGGSAESHFAAQVRFNDLIIWPVQ